MPSSVGHAALAVLLQPLLPAAHRRRRVLLVAALAVAVLDLDAMGRPFGLGDVWFLGGHRALTHAPVFTLLLAGALVAALARTADPRGATRRYIYLAAVLCSHGILDAMTTYGEGVTFAAPFSWMRWKLAWRPFTGIFPEALLLWTPAGICLWAARAKQRAATAASSRLALVSAAGETEPERGPERR